MFCFGSVELKTKSLLTPICSMVKVIIWNLVNLSHLYIPGFFRHFTDSIFIWSLHLIIVRDLFWKQIRVFAKNKKKKKNVFNLTLALFFFLRGLMGEKDPKILGSLLVIHSTGYTRYFKGTGLASISVKWLWGHSTN